VRFGERLAFAAACVCALLACERSAARVNTSPEPSTAVRAAEPTAATVTPSSTPSSLPASPEAVRAPSASAGPSVAPVVTAVQSAAPSTQSSVPVPAGSVEVAGKQVAVAAFGIDRTEVTTKSYARCVSEGKCSEPGAEADCNYPKRDTRGEHPINCVSAEQARRYCAAHGQRLPTIAEWQLAAGGTEARRYPWGADHPSNMWVTEAAGDSYPPGPARRKLCWVGDGTAESETYPTSTCPVGSYAAGNTASGIADLAGNVAEWTSDVEKLPEGGKAHRTKGGGFSYDPMGPLPVAVTDSEMYPDSHRAADVGFRCVTAAAGK